MTHHYLLTRFNLALWQENKNGQTIDREEWIRKRLKLFETYCVCCGADLPGVPLDIACGR